jgi:antitoxin CcdA
MTTDEQQREKELERRALRVERVARDRKYPVAAILRANDWKAQNADAIASTNAWVEEHGLPLAQYRMF